MREVNQRSEELHSTSLDGLRKSRSDEWGFYLVLRRLVYRLKRPLHRKVEVKTFRSFSKVHTVTSRSEANRYLNNKDSVKSTLQVRQRGSICI